MHSTGNAANPEKQYVTNTLNCSHTLNLTGVASEGGKKEIEIISSLNIPLQNNQHYAKYLYLSSGFIFCLLNKTDRTLIHSTANQNDTYSVGNITYLHVKPTAPTLWLSNHNVIRWNIFVNTVKLGNKYQGNYRGK